MKGAAKAIVPRASLASTTAVNSPSRTRPDGRSPFHVSCCMPGSRLELRGPRPRALAVHADTHIGGTREREGHAQEVAAPVAVGRERGRGHGDQAERAVHGERDEFLHLEPGGVRAVSTTL